MPQPHLTRVLAALATLCVAQSNTQCFEEVSFRDQVLPLLSDRCFSCHGPDESNREADLRLDTEAEAMVDRGGYAAIVPSDAAASEAFKRMISEDEDLVMPPADSHRKPFTKAEIEIIRKWIDSGAKWGKHWAFEKPVRPEVPAGAKHPIDAFVRQRLEGTGLKPAERAPPHTLARRLSFDLTGLPPTIDQVASLNGEAESYEALVDALMASPAYGERMAMWWLDAARYSDTDGFQQDQSRNNWPWRDWVIDSFNKNMPFDQFTIEQFAGDLLPDATKEQQLATCFHRNHQTNGEGGRLAEESRVDYVIDRVNTTGTVWLGLTLGCCQCHSHKFDPISQREYYELSTFFNSINETGAAGNKANPYLKYTSPYVSELAEKARKLANARQATERKQAELAEPVFEQWLADQTLLSKDGYDSWSYLNALELGAIGGTKLKQLEDRSVLASGPNPTREYYRIVSESPKQTVTAVKLEVLPDAANTEGRLSRNKTGEFVLTGMKLQVRRPGKIQVEDIDLSKALADLQEKGSDSLFGPVSGILQDDPRTGWTVSAKRSTEPHEAIVLLKRPLELEGGEQLIITLSHGSRLVGANLSRFRLSVSGDPAELIKPAEPTPMDKLAELKAESPADIPKELKDQLRRHFLAIYEPYQQAKQLAAKANQQAKRIDSLKKEVNVMVLGERDKPRDTFVLERGVWDQHGEKVTSGVPQAVLPWKPDQVKTRLDLANWLVSPENPLTARVVVNHLWQICFGAGLVRTPEDFGLQGDTPTHPELLDWLAVELVESGWDMKHVLRLIVTSETYQQSSHYTPELLELDPKNKLLARAPRFRLPSWMIRDAAFATSGLLDDTRGGPPVLPYQPEGVWEALFKGRFTYDTSQGELQFRRTVYVFWRRAVSPTFLFDVAPRRVCEVRPRRTNTPLHALTLMNDLGQLEAARALGVNALAEEKTIDERVKKLFRRIISRPPTEAERRVLKDKLEGWLTHYRSAPEEAKEFLEFGQPELYVTEQVPETAAYTVLASLILNLDEAITHE